MRNLRKNPIFTVINHFDPYQEGFFTVNLQGHVGACRGLIIFAGAFPEGKYQLTYLFYSKCIELI
jgi:hypothetical protein